MLPTCLRTAASLTTSSAAIEPLAPLGHQRQHLPLATGQRRQRAVLTAPSQQLTHHLRSTTVSPAATRDTLSRNSRTCPTRSLRR